MQEEYVMKANSSHSAVLELMYSSQLENTGLGGGGGGGVGEKGGGVARGGPGRLAPAGRRGHACSYLGSGHTHPSTLPLLPQC